MWKHEILKAKHWRGQPFNVAHAKLDGHHLAIFKQASGVVYAMTTAGHDIVGQIKHYPWMGPIYSQLPPFTSIMGELYVPGQPASCVKTALKSKDPELTFTAFAVPYLEGENKFRVSLWEVSDWCQMWGIGFASMVTDTFDEASLIKRARGEGLEGWVLKVANYLDWWKLKVEQDPIDLVVTGFKDGKGKYLGLVGSLVCSTSEGYEVASVSGMTDQTRFEIDEDKDVNRVCEVAYQYVGAKGRLRHPRFNRWRDDKTADQCPASQNPELARYWSAVSQQGTGRRA